MNKAALVVNVEAMIAQNPISVTFTKSDDTTQTVTCGEANIRVSEKQIDIGNQQSYRRSIWSIKDDWDELPEKKQKLTIGSTVYRIQNFVDYYMGTARRYDLGDEYEMGAR